MNDRQLTPEDRRDYLAMGLALAVCAIGVSHDIGQASEWHSYWQHVVVAGALSLSSFIYLRHAWHNRYL